MSLNQATGVDPAVAAEIEDMFEYHPWAPPMVGSGQKVREALIAAVKVIVENVPPGPDRTVAIRKIREARMDCNSAITFGGRY